MYIKLYNIISNKLIYYYYIRQYLYKKIEYSSRQANN